MTLCDWLASGQVHGQLLGSLADARGLGQTQGLVLVLQDGGQGGDHGVVLLLVAAALLGRGGEAPQPEARPLLAQLGHLQAG